MIVSSIPSPSFSAIHLGPLTIRMYAVMILLGIVVAFIMTLQRWKRVGGNADQLLSLTLIAIITGIIGARIYHIITTPERFFGSQGSLINMVKIWEGGLGIWGGVALGSCCVWLYCRAKHYPTALLADAVAPGMLVAQAIGRLGNWFNQELYGAPTTLPWGLKIDDSHAPIGAFERCYTGVSCPTNTLFHPTFLYEMIWNLLGAALLIYIGKKLSPQGAGGRLFAGYVLWYTIGRSWIEMLRIDYSHTWLNVRINVWVSLAVAIGAVIVLLLLQRYGASVASLQPQLESITQREEAAYETEKAAQTHARVVSEHSSTETDDLENQ